MTRSKDGKSIGKTVESYLQLWIKENIYGKTKDIQSKYTTKGLDVESIAIDFIAEYLGYGMLEKNEKHFENDFIKGTPDIILKDHLIDNKSSWDFSTFPLLSDEIDKDYYYQGQGYMALTGVNKYKLIYTLIDTPEDLIHREANNHCYKNGVELTDEVLNYFIEKMTYSKVPDNLKIKVFEFERNDQVIEQIYNNVIQCRESINELLSHINLQNE